MTIAFNKNLNNNLIKQNNYCSLNCRNLQWNETINNNNHNNNNNKRWLVEWATQHIKAILANYFVVILFLQKKKKWKFVTVYFILFLFFNGVQHNELRGNFNTNFI